jgi:nucleotidyltransferase substrate binding protein (TIGR01987 family)
MGGARLTRTLTFERALLRLEEGLEKPEDAIVRDACVQRFEFTFEMAWRAVQAFAMAEGLDCVSPRECFRTGFRLGLIENDPLWMAMVEDRNRTSHMYDEDVAREIYGALSGYARLFRTLLTALHAGEERQVCDIGGG